MKAIMVMFDSLNRHMLPAYGCDWVHTPNFRRLAQHSATFENSYVCSMPCMPARRDLHTGRPNFLHRSWGPLEPFDDSMPQMLKEHGIYTHLATDHQHYWEDGGATYHQRYTSFDLIRGQEGDPWHPIVDKSKVPATGVGRNADDHGIHYHDRVNRLFMRREQDQPQPRTFEAGLRFLEHNHDADNWFLQVETFDPHEPFFTQAHFRDLYAGFFDGYEGPVSDWPPYAQVREDPAFVEQMRHHNAALISMCDKYLGQVLDAMDRHGLWEDTLLTVWTDHGFLLGEHDCWAKIWCPMYNEIARTPFFVWDPRSGHRDVRRQALVQPSIDLPVTLLAYFGLGATPDMLGADLAPAVADDTPVREAAIFGQFGGHVNVTDGRYVYMAAPPAEQRDAPLYEYTHMPTRMKGRFTAEEMQGLDGLAEPFSFTKGCRTMKIRGGWSPLREGFETMLFDLEQDRAQNQPIADEAVEQRMRDHLVQLMRRCDAPPEQFERLDLMQKTEV
ncbi:MAG: sulfatase [Phycisphaeraceae bacterium]